MNALSCLLQDLTGAAPFLERLAALFSDMDTAYGRSAGGFVCTGCEDNCCRSRFYHHTLLEMIYLHEGLASLAEADRQAILERAQNARKRLEGMPESPAASVLCPLNENERCLLYRFRPMICRMHGIPHLLRRPGRPPHIGPGCREFHDRCGHENSVLFDRTPFYEKMARLEAEIRARMEFSQKVRLTVADMLLLFPETVRP